MNARTLELRRRTPRLPSFSEHYAGLAERGADDTTMEIRFAQIGCRPWVPA